MAQINALTAPLLAPEYAEPMFCPQAPQAIQPDGARPLAESALEHGRQQVAPRLAPTSRPPSSSSPAVAEDVWAIWPYCWFTAGYNWLGDSFHSFHTNLQYRLLVVHNRRQAARAAHCAPFVQDCAMQANAAQAATNSGGRPLLKLV